MVVGSPESVSGAYEQAMFAVLVSDASDGCKLIDELWKSNIAVVLEMYVLSAGSKSNGNYF